MILVKLLFALFTIILLSNCEILVDNQPYEPIIISKIRLNEHNAIYEVRNDIDSRISCMNLCLALTTNCTLGCFVKSVGCILTDVLVSPNYVEPETTDLYKCYTKLIHTNIIVGKAITGTPTAINWYSKGSRMTTVVDGLYEAAKSLRYISNNINKAYIQIDLGEPMSFSVIQLRCSDGEFQAEEICFNYYIKTSSQPPITPGDFSSFDDFAFIDKPQEPRAPTFVKPTTARYISIQRKSPTPPVQYTLLVHFLNVY